MTDESMYFLIWRLNSLIFGEEVHAILNPCASPSPFPMYVMPVSRSDVVHSSRASPVAIM